MLDDLIAAIIAYHQYNPATILGPSRSIPTLLTTAIDDVLGDEITSVQQALSVLGELYVRDIRPPFCDGIITLYSDDSWLRALRELIGESLERYLYQLDPSLVASDASRQSLAFPRP